MAVSIFALALECLSEESPSRKIELTNVSSDQWSSGKAELLPADAVIDIPDAGRPARPRLVASFRLPRRSMVSDENLPAFVHALSHIEFNAINLAWDAVYRFRDMPRQFYSDWIRVAREEAYHFSLLQCYLNTLGHDYGDFDAHGGLWRMAVQTAHDPLLRMALVPRVLEARGLDVTPGMIEKLRAHQRDELAEILKIIYDDEIGHVEIGTRWFHFLCEQRGLDARSTFETLVAEYAPERIKPPINEEGREQAGFTRDEIDYLYTFFEQGARAN